MNKIMAHWQKAIPSIRDTRDDVSEQLDAVFQKMVAPETQQSLPSMSSTRREASRESTLWKNRKVQIGASLG